jgi:hypothetical protein
MADSGESAGREDSGNPFGSPVTIASQLAASAAAAQTASSKSGQARAKARPMTGRSTAATPKVPTTALTMRLAKGAPPSLANR